MKLYSRKYIFGPITLSIIAFIISPLLNISHSPIMIDKKDSNTSKSTSDNSILNTIIESFNLSNRAFAECSGYCFSVPSICVPEGGNINSTIESYETRYSGGFPVYPVSIDIQSDPNITVSPLSGVFNNYPAGPPDSQRETLTYTGVAPSVSVTDDPGDNSGPYSGKGRKEFSMSASDSRRPWDGSAWGAEVWYSNSNVSFMISVDHANNAPTVNTISPDYSASVANSSTTSNIPVSVSFNDVESNHTNVLLELSNNNFSSTIQSFTQNGVSAGTLVDHTFTNVSPGSYQWRATATETDAIGACGAAGVNLAVSATRNINLNLPGSSSSSSPPSAPSCSSQKPDVPSGFTAVVGPEKGQETLSWFAPQGPVTDYSITYSDNPNTKKWGVVSTGNATSYVISKLGSGKYYFWVNAVNGCMPGDLVSSSGSALPPTGSREIIYIGMLGILIMSTGFWFLAKNK